MRKLSVTAGVTLLLLAGLLLTESGRSTGRAALLVAGLFAPGETTPLGLLVGEPVVSNVTIPVAGKIVEGRLYAPDDTGSDGALILVAGYPSDIDDRQLASVATDLARMGIVALIPRLPALRNGRLSTDDVAALVAVFEWLSEQPTVAADHIGFAGFCVGSSLALLAAEDPRINGEVKLVNVFGGYFDLTSLLRAVATHSADYRGTTVSWQPAPATVMLVTQNILAQLPRAEDRVLLQRTFGAGEPADETLASLTPEGLTAYRLLSTTESAAFDQVLAELPTAHKAYLVTLSPSRGIADLRARLFIMHDEDDPYIPVGESYRLAAAIVDPAQKQQATFRIFAHVRPRRMADQLILVQDGVKLVGYLDDILWTTMPRP